LEFIELKNIEKNFYVNKQERQILKGINLSIKENEFLTLLGPSGSGKTTTLRIIGGFETASKGQVFFNGLDIGKTPPHKRAINTVFQNYALFPHMNVYDNVAYGLKIKKFSKSAIKDRVEKTLSLVNLSGFDKRSVKSLSGGQQQRIAIARALINEPKVLLLDEPLGALDLKLRKEMQIELKNMQKNLGITFIYVTHDQEEALTMSDQIAVMNDGEILQKGTSENIYNEPKNAFIASFIGTSNIITGTMERDRKVTFLKTDFECVDPMPGSVVQIVVRPEDIEIEQTPRDRNSLKGEVIEVIFFGVNYEMKVKTGDFIWKIHSTKSYERGQFVYLFMATEALHVMEMERSL